jgi:glycolate oxidase
VTGLEVVLPYGELVVLGRPELDGPGYDLLGAFVGSEGKLGIGVRAWLRVVPVPEAAQMFVATFDDMAAAGRPAGLLLAELDGPRVACEGLVEVVAELCRRCGSTGIRMPRDGAERERFWKLRKAAFGAKGRISRTTSSRTA